MRKTLTQVFVTVWSPGIGQLVQGQATLPRLWMEHWTSQPTWLVSLGMGPASNVAWEGLSLKQNYWHINSFPTITSFVHSEMLWVEWRNSFPQSLFDPCKLEFFTRERERLTDYWALMVCMLLLLLPRQQKLVNSKIFFSFLILQRWSKSCY